MYAASAGNVGSVHVLLGHGADIEVKGNDGNTPLIDAALDTNQGDITLVGRIQQLPVAHSIQAIAGLTTTRQ